MQQQIYLLAYAEDDRPSIVYIAKNLINGKRYIGITRLSLVQRQDKHIANALRGQNGMFYAAMRKHGSESFEFSVLENCPSYTAALDRERHYIKELKPEYNMTWGGEGVLGHRHSEETRKKMSAAKGNKAPWGKGECSPEIRKKLSESAKRRKGKYPPKTPEKKQAWLELSRVANNSRRAPVYCIDDGLAFRSATEAADHYGVTNATIVNICDKKNPTNRLKRTFVRVELYWGLK